MEKSPYPGTLNRQGTELLRNIIFPFFIEIRDVIYDLDQIERLVRSGLKATRLA